MKKLIVLGLVYFSLLIGGCQNETTPTTPGGGNPGEPQPGQTPSGR